MATQRTIVRTCERCMGTKRDRTDLPRYQWFLLAGLAICSFATPNLVDNHIPVGAPICVVSGLLILWSLKRGCPVCKGTGERRIVERISETLDDEAAMYEAPPTPPQSEPRP